MKPWTERKQIASALRNEHVRIGERTLADGTVLRGLYATAAFAAGDYVASFHGSIISRETLAEMRTSDPERFEHVNDYAVLIRPGGHLYPEDLNQPGGHLINHSCGPNTVWGSFERGARLVQAVRPINTGEELTVHYGWLGLKGAMENRRHRCMCQARLCTGTIELRVEIDNDDGRALSLSPNEIALRLAADIVNDTDANEDLLHSYATRASDSVLAGGIRMSINDAFFDKLRDGAQMAVERALSMERAGCVLSRRRLKQVVHRYHVAMSTVRYA